MTTPEERRAKIGSLISEPIPYFEEDKPRPVKGEEASPELIQRLLHVQSSEDLEKAGKISRAKWKIQIWIKSDRSIHKPLVFSLSFWESGKRLHGGGDESAFVCRRNPGAPMPPKPPFAAIGRSPFKAEATTEGCNGVILGEYAQHGRVVCPHCGVQWDTEHIADSIFYRVPVERAGVIISDWFHKLEDSCDLYIKYRAQDIRTKMMAQHYGLAEAIRLKGLAIYPLAHIMTDAANGTPIEALVKRVLLA